MKTLEFIYQETQIHFLVNQNTNVMVNATEMANLFGKRVDHFKSLDSTKLFISELIEHENNKKIHRDHGGFLTEKDIIQGKGRGGTYMHRKLAIEFAMWLDVKFKLWVVDIIEDIVNSRFNHYNKHWEAHQRLEAAKAEVQRLRPLLLENPDRELIGQYFNAEDVIKNAKKTKANAIKNQYKIDFE